MSERVGAVQTPDIEALLAKWTGCWCGEQQYPDHDPRVRDCPQHGSDDCRHMAEGIAADLRRLTAAVREARAAELREVADEIASWEVIGNDLLDSELGRNIGYLDAAQELRGRADRIDVDAPEGGEGR